MYPREHLNSDYDLMMNNVIQGELEQASYLKSIIEMMEINKYKNESVVSFIEFIKRSADYNVASLYNIIKMICTIELKPEIQDIILQEVTGYLMISRNKQYGFLSKLILDINMISPKCQFLHKLTSGIAKTLLKFDEDTVKDFNNLIYKCYCTVRHDCRDEKDKNITKYKDHFTFIASMEAEEEMKKLTSLTNFLLMLTLLLIASGGHHKSAKLKKYLSLKYEYRDSILYLLWCSGDVEINPGPTFRTLRKIPDSVKERNWIYEMCSILLRLLKYRSIDLKNGGLWKEKPLHWPPEWPFYDPRNKPKGQGYNTGTDKQLLECLEEHCHTISSEGYTDIVRDIAITFCRIGKGLNILAKSDGIWKTPPSGWNPNQSYFSPCNAGKRKEKGQYQTLVDNLLTFCEYKNKAIPSELQSLTKAWKEKNTSEITKYYTIWSKTAIVKHSLQYLEKEGLLNKIHVQESLKHIGVILDMQHWGCPSVNTSCTRDNDDKSQDSAFSDHLHSSPSSDIEANSTAKIASIQINSDNPSTQLPNSAQTNTKDTPASPHSLVGHIDGHLCNTASDQKYIKNESSKQTCVNSCKVSCSILTSKLQPEADVKHHLTSSVNALTSKGEVIPCAVHIHDATSKPDSNNKISKTAKKRGNQKNDESPTEPKRLHISEEDDPLLLHILTSLAENGKVLSYTRRKDCSKDGDIIYIVPNQFPHDLISIQSRLNPLATKKQTDQLLVKDLTDIASDKQEDSSLSNRKDGETNKANKNKTTSDQYVDKIVDLLEELDQDYSSTVLEGTIPISCSSTDQSSDSSDEFPEPIKLCVDTYLNSYNPDDTLETDIEQFIEEQGMDSG
ncbi:unnamed protein product [Mytilus edulis]|uniref:Uncharacterized protein n=1 Tax=Mytilus edulis TaxID=6550 RepID=A0A8S3RC66_MYTED|nr:unnamed protein product [Mytilus edulis]